MKKILQFVTQHHIDHINDAIWGLLHHNSENEYKALIRFLLIPITSPDIDSSIIDIAKSISSFKIYSNHVPVLKIVHILLNLSDYIKTLIIEDVDATDFVQTLESVLKSKHALESLEITMKGVHSQNIIATMNHIPLKSLKLHHAGNLNGFWSMDLQHIESLDLKGCSMIIDKEIEGLLPSLKRITLPNLNRLDGNKFLSYLATKPLEYFDSGDCEEKLNFHQVIVPSLKHVGIHSSLNNEVFIPILRYLTKEDCKIMYLDLSRAELTVDQCVLIAEMIENNSSLESLNLSNISIGDKPLSKIAKAIGVHLNLKRLNLSYTEGGTEFVKRLSESLIFNPSIEQIYLDGIRLGHNGLKHLFSGSHAHLETLSLVGCSLKEDCVSLITSFLRKSKVLKTLDISDNKKLAGRPIQLIREASNKNEYLKRLEIVYVQ